MDFTLSLTHDCNLGCTYCYAGEKRPCSMTPAVAERAIDFAFSFAADTVQLGFFGGEPLFEWDLLRRSTERVEAVADARGVMLNKTLTTNGTALTPDKAHWLRDHGFFVAVSIDGHRAMHDLTRPFRNGRSSFEACRRGVRAARAVFDDFEVIVVPDPVNVTHLADGVRFLVEAERAPRVSVNPNFYAAWSDEALAAWSRQWAQIADFVIDRYRAGEVAAINFIDGKIITRLKRGHEACDRCNFGEHEIAVAPSGRLYPCERLVGADNNEDMCIGNVFDGFDENERRRILRRRGNVNPECGACSIRERCMNWCCCINYALTGVIDRTDGIVCFHERMCVREADRVAATLFAERNALFLARYYGDDLGLPAAGAGG